MKRFTQHVGSSALIRCCKITFLTLAALAATIGSAVAATVTVTNIDDGVSNVGAPGTLYWAITNCNPGDTIAFNIDTTLHGAGPYFFKGPVAASTDASGGFPLIYRKHNLLIDGYTQPGSSPNTNPINAANNAVIKIVIDGRDGGSRGMDASTWDGTLATCDPPIDNTFMSTERTGYGNSERALLGVYRSTNVWIRGLAFYGTFSDPNGDQKLIEFERDYDGVTNNVFTNTVQYADGLSYQSGSDRDCHVSGCWFGVDLASPSDVNSVHASDVGIAHYRHRDISGGSRPELPSIGLIIGVAPKSANPRAEFNVFVGFGYCEDGENLRTRVSGNFFGVFPDGVTAYNMTALNDAAFDGGLVEWGRYSDTQPIICGTDGDGVNDADEGNVFGPLALEGGVGGSQPNWGDIYGTSRKPYIIAGNRFGVDINGTPFTDCSFRLFDPDLNSGTQLRFGSDFNGVSDDLEANIIYNNHDFATQYPTPATAYAPSFFGGMDSDPGSTTDGWVSVRGNISVNNFPTFNPDDSTAQLFNNWWSNFVVYASAPSVPDAAIPALSGGSTVSSISGTFLPPNNGYNTVVVDLYEVDPEGEVNGAAFNYTSFGGTSGWGFVQGKTYLGSYVVPNPASGTFTWNSPPGVSSSMKVTVALTYSTFAQPVITSVTPGPSSTVTLTWTGDNGGPYQDPGAAGGPSSGFGVQSSPTVVPWSPTTTFASGNSATVAAPGFYRIVAPINGMTTLCAPPVTLP